VTLAITSPTNTYIGNGSTNVYPFTFPVFAIGDVQVTVSSPANPPVVYNLVLGTDYTITALNPTGGPAMTGSLTLINASQAWLTGGFLTTAWTITLTRVVSLIQNTSFRNQGSYFPAVIENELDYIVMMIQQLQQAITTIQAGSNIVQPGIIIADQVDGHTYQIISSSQTIGLRLVT
jgi:hypothetical protein